MTRRLSRRNNIKRTSEASMKKFVHSRNEHRFRQLEGNENLCAVLDCRNNYVDPYKNLFCEEHQPRKC